MTNKNRPMFPLEPQIEEPSDRFEYGVVYNESGEGLVYDGHLFGFDDRPLRGHPPAFARSPKSKIAEDYGILTDEEKAANGEFWVDSRRGPKAIRDIRALETLGIEVSRDRLLDRRSGGC